jgi:hypothetical protein
MVTHAKPRSAENGAQLLEITPPMRRGLLDRSPATADQPGALGLDDEAAGQPHGGSVDGVEA